MLPRVLVLTRLAHWQQSMMPQSWKKFVTKIVSEQVSEKFGTHKIISNCSRKKIGTEKCLGKN